MGILLALPAPSIWLSGLTLLTSMAILYVIVQIIYNIFFHPLRSYPGPYTRAASRLPYTISIFRGDVTHKVKELHDKFGPVVRIAPDSLSYTCSQAWTDIYGLKQSDKRGNLPKDPKFYLKPPGCIDTISTADDANHRRLRRLQAHAFSEKALAMQESYLQQHTDQLISRLRHEAHQSKGVVDFVKWVNLLTTDLIGDLSFGESFGGLNSGKLHPWLEDLFTTLKTFTFIREILRLPSFIVNFAMACIPKEMLEHRKEAVSFGAEAAHRRIARGSDKPDFMSYILKHEGDESRGMSQAEIEMAAITFIVAGSETTATAVSGTIYLLLCNPSVLLKLASIIRSDFSSLSDLTNVKLQQHEYLDATLKEGLRLYPPAPDTLFRATTQESAIVAGRVVPRRTSLTMNIWAANRDPANFHRPLEFIPERWMKNAPPEFHNDDKAVFKPFSLGPRDCIGKNLAWAEMRMILGKLIWSFDFLSLAEDSAKWIERQKIYSLWEKRPLNVKIALRDY
ncbi:isotrichodermin C-15 hydroxylase [Thozetella sp. PMI_491]|nr:isotrichodermin C-15 hydroxylase [Thozetella sp. PMI_491]